MAIEDIIPKNKNLVKEKKKRKKNVNKSYSPKIKKKSFVPFENVNDFILNLRSYIIEGNPDAQFYSMEADRRDTLLAYDLMIENDVFNEDFLNGWCKFFAKNYANGIRAINKEKTCISYFCSTFKEYLNEFNAGRNTEEQSNL